MNKLLDSIDEFLNSQKENEAKVFFILPVLLFGFLSYYFIYPITDENLINANDKFSQLEQKINKTEKSNNSLNTENMKIKTILKKADKELVGLRAKKDQFSGLVKQLNFLKFDLEKWVTFYNSIPSLAYKNKVLVVSLDNKMDLNDQPKKEVKKVTKPLHKKKKRRKKSKKSVKEKNSNKIKSSDLVKKKMDITIIVWGDFVNFIKFMNAFENRKEFIKIKSISVLSHQMVLTIEIYGAKL